MISLWEEQLWYLMSECQQHNVPCITSQTRDFLRDLDKTYRPSSYLEIGSARGMSLFYMHYLMSSRSWRIVQGIERSLPNVERIQSTIESYHLVDIAIHHINANHAWWERGVIDSSIDFAFIDARKSNYHIYLQTILPYMSPTSVIVCDDVVKFAHKLVPLYEFLDHNQLNYETITLGDGDGVIVIKIDT